ncbi:hypothetical protein TNCV_2992821 [Trichonephila clavipes]|nr:hypothetical protein TNCV_2992821 [Trichonephila clavipes]
MRHADLTALLCCVMSVCYHFGCIDGRLMAERLLRESLRCCKVQPESAMKTSCVVCMSRLERRDQKLWTEQSSVLMHDNTPAHLSLLSTYFLAKTKTIVLPHPPYLYDLDPCDINLFHELALYF